MPISETPIGGATSSEVKISNDVIKIEEKPLIAKYQSKEQFVAALAKDFYTYAKIDNTSDAMKAVNNAFRNAIIFWNMCYKDYGSHLVDDSNGELKSIEFE